MKGCRSFTSFELYICLSSRLLRCGDIHPNPGPTNIPNTSTNITELTQHKLSIVHYNIQSFLHKKDLLYSELSDFDILCFTETWLTDNTPSADLLYTHFKAPFRQDRATDAHGGLLVYIKVQVYSIRRHDLEVPGNECIWIEIHQQNTRTLVGTFYRPPNAQYLTTIQSHAINYATNPLHRDQVVTYRHFSHFIRCPGCIIRCGRTVSRPAR
ncbi:MAG: endonuclease/exonuclease/phosphatase family protein [Sedimenticola sp.]